MFTSQYLFALIVVAAAVIYFLVKRNSGGIMAMPANYHGSRSPFLDQYSSNFTDLAEKGRIDPVIGREEEVRKLTQILSRREKNNAILIGAPGVGKTAIVEGFAQRIARGDVPEALLGKRVLALDVATLMSGTKYRGEFEQRAKKIVQEIVNSNRSIILFVDEVHSLIQSQGSEGSINLSDIL